MSIDGIDGLLQGAVANGTVEGAVAVITSPDGDLHTGAAGTGEDTMFRIASMTKAIASTALMQLVEKNQVGLDDEVRKYVPEIGELQVLDGFDGDEPILRDPKSQPTLRQLLTHSAGLGYFFTNEKLAKYHAVTGAPHVLTGIKAALSVPLANDPGEVWDYGVNTDYVGLVVEAVSGQDLNAYVAEHIAGPLGMKDTTFTPSDEQRARLLPIKMRMPDGSLGDAPIELPQEPEWHAGGHGLYSTAADYARFVRAILRGGELDGARILEESTVDLMLSDQLQGATLPAEGITSQVPELANDVPALPFQQGWGLGFHLLLEDLPGMRTAGTGDWAGIMNSYYFIDRAAGIGMVFMTQVLPFYDQGVVELTLGIEAAVYAARSAQTAA